MVIKKKGATKRAVTANTSRINRRIRAAEETNENAQGGVDIAPEASDLLFEAEDVAELVAEVTGQDVAVTADEDVISFEVGDDVYTVEAEGDEEILESTRKPLRNKKTVRASRKPARRSSRRSCR